MATCTSTSASFPRLRIALFISVVILRKPESWFLNMPLYTIDGSFMKALSFLLTFFCAFALLFSLKTLFFSVYELSLTNIRVRAFSFLPISVPANNISLDTLDTILSEVFQVWGKTSTQHAHRFRFADLGYRSFSGWKRRSISARSSKT